MPELEDATDDEGTVVDGGGGGAANVSPKFNKSTDWAEVEGVAGVNRRH